MNSALFLWCTPNPVFDVVSMVTNPLYLHTILLLDAAMAFFLHLLSAVNVELWYIVGATLCKTFGFCQHIYILWKKKANAGYGRKPENSTLPAQRTKTSLLLWRFGFVLTHYLLRTRGSIFILGHTLASVPQVLAPQENSNFNHMDKVTLLPHLCPLPAGALFF